MAIESAIFYLAAVALPLWLVVEAVMHETPRRAARPTQTAVPAPRALSAAPTA